VLIGLGLFVVWRFWGFFSSLWDLLVPQGPGVLQAAADAATNVQVAAHNASNAAAVASIAPGQNAAFLAMAEADAQAIAVALNETGVMANFFAPHKETAYRLIKPYGRVLYGAGGKVAVTNGREHLRNPNQTMRVLQPFYAQATGGRNLRVDLDETFKGSDDISNFYRRYIRV
jgi:hypothetical protein